MKVLGETINIFNEKWFVALRDACRPSKDNDCALDWRRMAAIIYLLSNGDISKRTIDWDFLNENLGPDNPTLLPFYDNEEMPTIEVIDRATRWGLFQIRGDTARQMGYEGGFLGLASTGANIKFGIKIFQESLDSYFRYITKLEKEGKIKEAQEIEEQLPGIAEKRAFGVDPEDVDRLVDFLDHKIKQELESLQDIYE